MELVRHHCLPTYPMIPHVVDTVTGIRSCPSASQLDHQTWLYAPLILSGTGSKPSCIPRLSIIEIIYLCRLVVAYRMPRIRYRIDGARNAGSSS